MHLVFMMRGIQQQRDIYKKFLETQMFRWIRQPLLRDEKGEFIKNEDGTFKRGDYEATMVQGALRPIELYEYVFPKDSIKVVDGKLLPDSEANLKDVLSMMRIHDVGTMRPEINNFAWILRKMMKLQKLPEFPEFKGKTWEQVSKRYLPGEAVAIYPIGVKDDHMIDLLGYHQEGL
jgi:hypothetical protein